MAATKPKKKRESSSETGAYRRTRPVRVRRSAFDWRNWPWRAMAAWTLFVAGCAGSLYAVDDYVRESERFRLAADGSGLIVSGLELLDERDFREIFANDFGKPIGDLPLDARRTALIETPWVREAAVARLWPDRIWVHVVERRPVAYVRLPGPNGSLETRMIDADGVFLEPIEGVAFELHAVDGIDPKLPAAERAERVRLFARLIAALDAEEPGYSSDLGAIDVSNPNNARVTTVHEGDVIELALGEELFRHRYEVYLEYIDSWKRKFGSVGSVDLTLESQVVVLPADTALEAGAPQGD